MLIVFITTLYIYKSQVFQSFFCGCLDPISIQTLDRPIRQVTESIRLNKVMLEKNSPIIEKFLTAKGF
uniref:Uncharacterized protein n=1 Tax=Heterorhabditis bacteriophora TaxID=37862 RepID=A0A1I7X3X6_HETBA